ncbi:MAG: NAD(P)H-dependent oxidoreductase subunit E [Anaerolineaceae bacterium]|nr:NAD(P)H-dependent oxidoreductase subunit E [Anaerolineaceae bacterium]
MKNLYNKPPLNNPEKKLIIDQILEENKDLPGATMVILNLIQEKIGYVSKPVQNYVAEFLDVPISVIHGVISFYSFFTMDQRGEKNVKLCMGTACYVGGTPQLIDKAKQELNITLNETTPDGKITLEICRCVGACSQAPVVVVDDELHGNLTPQKFTKLLKNIQK